MKDPGARPVAAHDDGLTGELLESINLLDGGAEAYPRMLLSLEQAERTVHLEVYAFAPSGIGERFTAALGRAVKRGVKAEVTIDGWGSIRGGRAVAAMLRNAGCTVRIFSRLLSLWAGHFGRNHRKLLLVDDRVAFIGGINIGDENLGEGTRVGWADLALEIRGLPCVRLGEMIRNEPRHASRGLLRIHLSGLGGGWRLRRQYLDALANAKERIHLAHGYFLPDPGIVRAILAAARRGVQVRLLLAGRSDVPFTRAATRSLYRRFLAAGIEIHEWGDSVLHAKVATVDGRCLLVGSFNLDPFSLTNQEVLVAVREPRVVHQAETWIQEHFARSPSITSVESASLWQRWIIDPAGRMLARIADKLSRIIVSQRRRKHVKLRTSSRSPPGRLLRKTLVSMLALSVLGVGVAIIVLPGPGVFIVALGLAILATGAVWARQILRRFRSRAGS